MLNYRLILIALSVLGNGAAKAESAPQPLVLAPGTVATLVKGAIKGQEDRRYTLAVGEGQVLHVLFTPSNSACYFNAYAPANAESAVHIGSRDGHEFGASPAQAGLWRFDIYLMRSAARRQERCRFAFSVELTGKPGGASAGVSDQMMRDQCFAKAAPMYGVKKRAITLGAITANKEEFAIDGTVDKGREGIKQLRCRFTVERRFIEVMAMTPDGE